jgi:hypothetical protein
MRGCEINIPSQRLNIQLFQDVKYLDLTLDFLVSPFEPISPFPFPRCLRSSFALRWSLDNTAHLNN